MLPDRVSNPGPLTYESGALLIALCGPGSLSLIKLVAKEIRFSKHFSLYIKDNSQNMVILALCNASPTSTQQWVIPSPTEETTHTRSCEHLTLHSSSAVLTTPPAHKTDHPHLYSLAYKTRFHLIFRFRA